MHGDRLRGIPFTEHSVKTPMRGERSTVRRFRGGRLAGELSESVAVPDALQRP